MSNKIYITDLPETCQIIKGIKRWQEESQAAIDAWFEFARKYFGSSKNIKVYGGNRLKAVVLTDDHICPHGWRFSKEVLRGVVPDGVKNKTVYQEFKNLPKKPDSWELNQYTGITFRKGIGARIYFLTFEYDINDNIIVGLPVDLEGNHHPIPDGARELHVTEYLQLTKGTNNE